MKPLGDTKLYVTEVAGSFTAYFKVSLITGLIVALPYIFWQLLDIHFTRIASAKR